MKYIYNLRLAIMGLIAVVVFSDLVTAGILTGVVRDVNTGEPIPMVTIRVEGTGRSMLANEEGRYRIRLEPGEYRLKFSHVAHYSEFQTVHIQDSATVLDVLLKPSIIELAGLRVSDHQYDPGQQIILKAIAHKDDILKKIRKYTCDAYTKLVVCDTAKDDSSGVMLITETQLTCTWEYPDKYNELITARKQTSNLDAEGILVTIGRVLNFNENRIEFGPNMVVSPTAKDALDYYNYYLLDTLFIDQMQVFRLEIEPKNPNDKLFVGIIDIVDSSFSVVGVDVTFSEGVDFAMFDNLHYRQRFSQFENEYWLPIEIGFDGIIDLLIPGLPVLSIDYVAAMHEYDLHPDLNNGIFDFAIEVDEFADDFDSITWAMGPTIPLTDLETRGYEYQDSVVNAPKSFAQRARGLVMQALFVAIGSGEKFHFNRVEGAYAGSRTEVNWKKADVDLYLGGGYAFDAKRWQYATGFTRKFGRSHPLKLSVDWRNKVVKRETFVSEENYNPTFVAMMARFDPFDYYLEKGVEAGVSIRPFLHWTLSADYRDMRHESISNNTAWGIFGNDEHRPNPIVADGKLRSLGGSLTYDSRSMIRLKREEFHINELPRAIASIDFEIADPDLIDSEFDFVRVGASLTRTQRTLGLGLTSFYAAGGWSEGELPPQRYFSVDHGDAVFGNRLGFKTMDETSFVGNHAAMVYALHNFGPLLFRKSGIPLVKDIPFSLKLFGGAFWTDLKNQPSWAGDEFVSTANHAYGEIGFGIGRLPPIPWTLMFTWQLSDYNTSNFTIGFSMDMF